MARRGEVGLRRGKVKLVAHHSKWAQYFSQEKLILFKTLGKKVLDIRHIGSTSIPGLPAKPIVDIWAAVKTLADVDTFTHDLNTIGYEDKGDGGVPGRRFFVKGTEAKRTHHLNFCEMNSFFWRSHVAFRDHLELHPEIASEYSALKRRLADRFPDERGAYTAGKEEFVRSILDRAMNKTGTEHSDREWWTVAIPRLPLMKRAYRKRGLVPTLFWLPDYTSKWNLLEKCKMLPVGNPTYIGQYVRRWKLWLLSVCGKRLRVGHSSGPSTSLRITREHQHPEPKQHESARGGLRCRRGGGCTGSFGVCPKGKREFAIAGLYKLLLAWLDESSTVTQETWYAAKG